MGPMDSLRANGCAFSGRLPLNIDVFTLDLPNGNFSGPLVLFDERFVRHPVMQTLTLTSAGRLSYPIQLAALTSLTTLSIAGNGFHGCDWTNVTLPATIQQLDISDNSWLPFDLRIPTSVVSLRAVRAGITGVLTDTPKLPNLVEITLDSNAFSSDGNPEGVAVVDQLQYLLGEHSAARNLRSFSCQSCARLPVESATARRVAF